MEKLKKTRKFKNIFEFVCMGFGTCEENMFLSVPHSERSLSKLIMVCNPPQYKNASQLPLQRIPGYHPAETISSAPNLNLLIGSNSLEGINLPRGDTIHSMHYIY